MNSRSVLAFLVMALNPRRPYDEDYKGFMHLLTQQVTTPQLSAVILREEVERRQLLERQEALDRDRLYKELSESESKFARFAQRAPVGLAILKPDGTALSANGKFPIYLVHIGRSHVSLRTQSCHYLPTEFPLTMCSELWRDLTQLEVGSDQVTWSLVLARGELDPVMSSWNKVISEKKSITIQTRMRRPWKAPDLDRHGKVQTAETHILLAMYPDLDANGDITTIMSCITDISGLKWSEFQLRARMDQAIEMKKQQERFIDMTSYVAV
jgi:hypothetical protein